MIARGIAGRIALAAIASAAVGLVILIVPRGEFARMARRAV